MNYFEYTGADLYQLTEAFSDYLDCPEDWTPHFYLTSQGILTHLENELYSYMNEHRNETGEFAFLELDEDLHSYILNFLSELREDVRKRMNRRTEETFWREKFEYLTKLYKELDAQKPCESGASLLRPICSSNSSITAAAFQTCVRGS